MKLLVMHFSPFSCYFPLLGSHILLSTLYSNTINLHSSLRVRDQVEPHTSGKYPEFKHFNNNPIMLHAMYSSKNHVYNSHSF